MASRAESWDRAESISGRDRLDNGNGVAGYVVVFMLVRVFVVVVVFVLAMTVLRYSSCASSARHWSCWSMYEILSR